MAKLYTVFLTKTAKKHTLCGRLLVANIGKYLQCKSAPLGVEFGFTTVVIFKWLIVIHKGDKGVRAEERG